MSLAIVAAIVGIISGGTRFAVTSHDYVNRVSPRMIERCADAFKSYNPQTQIWVDFHGKHHFCPPR